MVRRQVFRGGKKVSDTGRGTGSVPSGSGGTSKGAGSGGEFVSDAYGNLVKTGEGSATAVGGRDVTGGGGSKTTTTTTTLTTEQQADKARIQQIQEAYKPVSEYKYLTKGVVTKSSPGFQMLYEQRTAEMTPREEKQYIISTPKGDIVASEGFANLYEQRSKEEQLKQSTPTGLSIYGGEIGLFNQGVQPQKTTQLQSFIGYMGGRVKDINTFVTNLPGIKQYTQISAQSSKGYEAAGLKVGEYRLGLEQQGYGEKPFTPKAQYLGLVKALEFTLYGGRGITKLQAEQPLALPLYYAGGYLAGGSLTALAGTGTAGAISAKVVGGALLGSYGYNIYSRVSTAGSDLEKGSILGEEAIKLTVLSSGAVKGSKFAYRKFVIEPKLKAEGTYEQYNAALKLSKSIKPGEIKEIRLPERIQTEAQPLVNQMLAQRGLIVSGSAAQGTQLKIARAPADVDVFARNPQFVAERFATKLRDAGFTQVEVQYSGKGSLASGKIIFGKGNKAIEFHTYDWMKEFPLYTGKTYKTPSGIRVMSIQEQVARKAFGGYVFGREKDIKDIKLFIKSEKLSTIEPSRISKLSKLGSIISMGKKGSLYGGIPQNLGTTYVKYPSYTGYSTYTKYPAYTGYSTYSKYPGYKPYDSYKPYETYKPYTPYKPYGSYKPYQPYTPYIPYTPYVPYKPYVPYSPYVPYTPYKPYQPYQGYKPYVPYEPYKTTKPKLGIPDFDIAFREPKRVGKRYQKRSVKYQPTITAKYRKFKAPARLTGLYFRPIKPTRSLRLAGGG